MKSIVLKIILGLSLLVTSFNSLSAEKTIRLNADGCQMFSQLFGAIGNDKITDKVSKETQLQILQDLQLSTDVKEFVHFLIEKIYASKAQTVQDYEVFGMVFLQTCFQNGGVVTFTPIGDPV